MIDGSELSFNKNIELTNQVVKLAESYDVPVEAELGYIAKLGQEHDAKDKYTKAEEAELFVKNTKVDALAIAIGTAHGFYKETPKLDFDRIAEIRKMIPNTVLVLHGSTGINHSELKKAISLGINKINVATEFKNLFIKSLKETLNSTNNIDLRQTFPKAIDDVLRISKKKIRID
ncbi:MAG: class II fructose-bisphosphate aldolase [Melioribacteraceae bacterium]|nr:class II fructose-bisphosphate aldolase [Melioribacteraceae bacterium]